ncbi:MAG TPA: hypothetical protein DDW30_00320 [Clostridiales bacterium]|nr:hypothetical protein [Clostridiales bacterium]
MKKRLFCLALCLVMLAATVLTGCSSKSLDEVQSRITDDASASAITLTMWLVSEKEVDSETASRITKAVNNITESKFTTRMQLYFLTDDEYRTVVTETIRKREDAKSIFADNAVKEEETTAADESGTVVNETETDKFGRITIKYPDLNPNQVDIIYINGEDMFREYAANGWLKRLDEELSASSKKIKEYVSQTLLSAAQIKGVSDGNEVNGTFAIPNNATIGKYTYMLLDKDLMEQTDFSGIYNKDEIDGFFNKGIFTYLDIVSKSNPDVVPVDATYDQMVDLLAHYWSIDPETYEEDSSRFSLLGYRYTNPKTLSKGQTILSFQNLFNDETFRKNYYELNLMRLNGYFGTAAEGQKAAVRFETGDLAKYESYRSEDSKYYPVIVKYPSVDVDDVYKNMFGVCAYTVNLSRSMQILTYLTTNVDFRNLIQYGEEDVDYKKTVDGNVVTIERLQETYMMDVFKTGNAFIAYPDPAKDLTADVWEIGKKQNRDALIEPLLNFDFAALAKASGAAAASDPKVGSSGFTYSWSTGYSREVLSQNDYLKAWMDSADRSGKGVYVLHTCASNVGQNLYATVYYYNNNIKNADVKVTDSGSTVNVSYGGSAGDGYEITVISFYGKKNSSKLDWTYTAGGTTESAKVTYRNAQIQFDFLNTKTYSVNLTAGLTKAMLADNAAAIAWVKAQSGSGAVVGTYTADNSEGGKTYTYLVYVPTISNPYSVSLMPTGTDKSLKLTVNYSTDISGKLGDSDAKYALFLVTVRADSDVAVDISLNGLTATEAPMEADPKLAFCGLLDVELVKYFDELTKKVEAVVNTATDKEKLKAIIDDLGILFTTRENGVFDNETLQGDLAKELTTDEVKKLASELDLERFYWSLLSATSTSEVKHKTEVPDGENMKVVDADKNPVCDEPYYYFRSPSVIYNEWASK